MEFAEKYELLESLTSGAVESFVAKNKARGDRVLVHILQCEPQKPNQPTVQWVLDGFRKLAPEPAGIVLETGRYSGTVYAYLVTTMPDDAALHAWVDRYNAQNVETQDIEPPPPENPVAKAPLSETSAPSRGEKPVQVPVQLTQIFRELDSHAKPAAPSEPATLGAHGEPVLTDLPPRTAPSFEKRFPSAVQAAPQWDELRNPSALGKEKPNAASPTPISAPEFPAKTLPSEAPPAGRNDSPKPGEFTSFWRGPFRVDGPPEQPISPPPPESEKKPSEFTLMFRQGAAPPDSVFSPATPDPNPSRSGMTGWVAHAEIMAQPANHAAPIVIPADSSPGPILPTATKESPISQGAATPPPVPSIAAPIFPLPVPPKSDALPVVTPAISSSVVGTSAFRTPVIEPVVASPPTPDGPSPYTQIISVKRAADVEAAQQQPASKLPPFAAPSKPAIPAIVAPPLPKAPLPPKLAPPAIKAPKTPKLDASKLDAAKPPVSYWPLVVTLTVLFFIAVLLVLYFALKH